MIFSAAIGKVYPKKRKFQSVGQIRLKTEGQEERRLFINGYVPFQRLGKLYDPETAIRTGTIFPELNITIDEYERGLYSGV